MEFPIIFEDNNLIAINKSPGISVHNAEDKNVLERMKSQYPKLYPVHRLDKETSGILLLAKNKETASSVQQLFNSDNIQKKYHCIIRGHISGDTGIWDYKLSDKAESRKNPAGKSSDRKVCQSKWIKLKANKYLSLLEVEILTGRQHQIRKHTAIAKHAIIGDSRYGDPKFNKKMGEIYSTDRMFLHSSYLSITTDDLNLELVCQPGQDFDIID